MNHIKYNYHMASNNQVQKEAYQLWEECFGDTKEYMDYYFQHKCKENTILALFEKEEKLSLSAMEIESNHNTMVSMLHLNPYKLKFYNQIISAHYIVGVATKQENRKQGLMRYLMECSLKELYKKGEIFTYLMPAKEEIYLPFDFRFVYEQHRYYKKIDKKNRDKKLSVKNWIELSDERKEEAVLFVEKKLAEMKNVYTIHDKEYYNKIRNEMKAAGGDVLLLYLDNNIVGVICYMQEEKKTEITETILEIKHTEQVIEYIEELFAEKEMEITYYDSSFVDTAVLEDRNYNEKKVPIIMARIVNLLTFFREIDAAEPMHVILKVKDDIILENNNTFILDYKENGEKRVEITEEEPQLTIEIGALTSLLLSNHEIFQSSSTFMELKKLRKFPLLYLNEIT